MSHVRAWISFLATGDQAEPWDGMLVTERGSSIEAIYFISDNKKLAQLTPDGGLKLAADSGLQPSADMAAFGRAVYRAMTGLEPPS